MPRIALTDSERLQRRQHLLATAHLLFSEQGQLPTVADIARRAGVAKGAVYLSFSTKEEIFVALLNDGFGLLLARLLADLARLPAQGDIALAIAQALSDSLRATPGLLPLAAMTSAVLEKNLPLQAMLDFKHSLATGLGVLGQALENSLPQLPHGEGAVYFLRSWALTLGLWQGLDCPAGLLEVLQQPELALFQRDFSSELLAAQTQFWSGVISRLG